ncbi:unnamed protein product, partial [Ixodes hexagonus]
KIRKDTGAKILQYFTKIINITTRQEIENATLRARLEEKEKVPNFAEVARAAPATVAGPPPFAHAAVMAGRTGGGERRRWHPTALGTRAPHLHEGAITHLLQ